MKKFLPIILVFAGILVLLGVYFLVIKKGGSSEEAEDDGALIEVSLPERPVTSLTPSSDGHWLKLNIDKILIKAETLDYELLYTLPDGRTQGVPGTITLNGESSIERDLLLGSESSGKFRYDEGVKEGNLTIRFRNSKGKLMVKFATKFHLQSQDTELTSIDEAFSYTLSDRPGKLFFVTMETFGVPDEPPANVTAGPYGVFGSDDGFAGTASLAGGKIYVFDNTWKELSGGESENIGIFIATD